MPVTHRSDSLALSVSEKLSAVFLAGYLLLCKSTIRWQSRGLPELNDALRDGPVILIVWHSRLMLGPVHWPGRVAKATTLCTTNRDGRIAAGVHRWFHLHPYGMSKDTTNKAASRAVLKRLRSGHSLLLTADGPRGPARVLQNAPLEWIRATDCPVFVYASSVRRQKRLPGWDSLLFPFPFSRGAFTFQRWPVKVSRKPSAAEWESYHGALTAALDAALSEADEMLGLPPGR